MSETNTQTIDHRIGAGRLYGRRLCARAMLEPVLVRGLQPGGN